MRPADRLADGRLRDDPGGPALGVHGDRPAGGRQDGAVERGPQRVPPGDERPPVRQQLTGVDPSGRQVAALAPAERTAVQTGDEEVGSLRRGATGGELLGGGVDRDDGGGEQFQATGGEERQPPDAPVGAEEVLDERVGGVGQQLGGRRELREPYWAGKSRRVN